MAKTDTSKINRDNWNPLAVIVALREGDIDRREALRLYCEAHKVISRFSDKEFRLIWDSLDYVEIFDMSKAQALKVLSCANEKILDMTGSKILKVRPGNDTETQL